MKILCWNTRELGNPRGVQTLCNLITKEDLDLVFLRETKVRDSFIFSKKVYFDFHNGLAADSVGKSGGLAILWNKDIDFEVKQFSNHHIHGVIKVVVSQNQP